MKRAIVTLIILACLFSCQKKKKSEEEPAPTTTGTTPVDDPMISVKINDTINYSCPALSCVSAYKSGGLRGISIGSQASKTHVFNFSFSSMPAPGSYVLDGSGSAVLQYVNNNTYYPVKTGNLNITSIDTTVNGVINHLRATFWAKTDTTLSPQYPVFKITEGIIKIR